jgi:hypothetical protein
MTRYISSSMESASEQPLVQFRLLAQIDVRSSTIYACTGGNFIAVGANTYSPVGHLGGVESIKEESDVFPRGVRLWLCAVGTANLAEPLSEELFNKSVRLYRTFIDVNSYSSVSTPELVFSGRVNRGEIKLADAERGNYYELEVESRLRKQAAAAYFTRETHWTVMGYSGDTFFDYLSEVSRRKVKWGLGEIVGWQKLPGKARLPKRGQTPLNLTPR